MITNYKLLELNYRLDGVHYIENIVVSSQLHDRYFGELYHLFTLSNFKDLEGNRIRPQEALSRTTPVSALMLTEIINSEEFRGLYRLYESLHYNHKDTPFFRDFISDTDEIYIKYKNRKDDHILINVEFKDNDNVEEEKERLYRLLVDNGFDITYFK